MRIAPGNSFLYVLYQNDDRAVSGKSHGLFRSFVLR